MRSTAPRREQLNRVQWFNDRRNAKDIFRLRLPKMSERNGRICCIRVVVVRMMDGQVGLRKLSVILLCSHLSPFCFTGTCRTSSPRISSHIIISPGTSAANGGRGCYRLGRIRCWNSGTQIYGKRHLRWRWPKHRHFQRRAWMSFLSCWWPSAPFASGKFSRQ